MSLTVNAQDVTLTGVVTDVNNEPLIGVNVVQKGTTKGTITDNDGRYSFEATPNSTIVSPILVLLKRKSCGMVRIH